MPPPFSSMSLLRVLTLSALFLLSGCERSTQLDARGAPGTMSLSVTPSAAQAMASPYTAPFERRPKVAELTQLGRTLFMDPGLSASGRMSCASCHDPAHGFGPPEGRAVMRGGAHLDQPGLRAVPSLRYRQTTPPFSEHFFENDGKDSEDQGPTGGYAWDGRARSAHEQAQAPLLSPFEMANESPAQAVQRLAASSSAAAFRAAFGDEVLSQPELAWLGLRWALEVFQQDPSTFYPYNSRYDAYLRGQARLSAAEQRGLKLFNDPARANCASCHPSGMNHGAFPQFTDHGLIALGAPRNAEIPANARADYFDLGLCGPMRDDFKDRPEYCGRFKTPSLRNVALRQVFFHNGVFHSLEQVMDFYANRDQHPERFYPKDGAGHVRMFDDLPPALRAGLHQETPFGHPRGEAPSFSKAEIADMIAFMKTLTDEDLRPDVKVSSAGKAAH